MAPWGCWDREAVLLHKSCCIHKEGMVCLKRPIGYPFMLIENQRTCLGDLGRVRGPGSGAPGNTAHCSSASSSAPDGSFLSVGSGRNLLVFWERFLKLNSYKQMETLIWGTKYFLGAGRIKSISAFQSGKWRGEALRAILSVLVTHLKWSCWSRGQELLVLFPVLPQTSYPTSVKSFIHWASVK